MGKKTKKTKEETLVLNLLVNDTFKNGNDFMDQNKPIIMMGVLESFKRLLDPSNKNVILRIVGNERHDDFTFQRSDAESVIKNDLIPYLIQQEEYELCKEANDLYNELMFN
jgi:hypothetical protein